MGMGLGAEAAEAAAMTNQRGAVGPGIPRIRAANSTKLVRVGKQIWDQLERQSERGLCVLLVGFAPPPHACPFRHAAQASRCRGPPLPCGAYCQVSPGQQRLCALRPRRGLLGLSARLSDLQASARKPLSCLLAPLLPRHSVFSSPSDNSMSPATRACLAASRRGAVGGMHAVAARRTAKSAGLTFEDPPTAVSAATEERPKPKIAGPAASKVAAPEVVRPTRVLQKSKLGAQTEAASSPASCPATAAAPKEATAPTGARHISPDSAPAGRSTTMELPAAALTSPPLHGRSAATFRFASPPSRARNGPAFVVFSPDAAMPSLGQSASAAVTPSPGGRRTGMRSAMLSPKSANVSRRSPAKRMRPRLDGSRLARLAPGSESTEGFVLSAVDRE